MSTFIYKCQSVDRAVALLDVVASVSPKSVSLKGIHAASGIRSKATVHRFLKVLVKHDLLREPVGGGYKLGFKIAKLNIARLGLGGKA